MYITFEKTEIDMTEMNNLGVDMMYSFWKYLTAYVPDENFTKLPTNMSVVQISEELARASKFAEVNLKDRPFVKYRVGSMAFDDVKDSLKLDPVPPKDVKVEYTVTSKDQRLAIEYISVVLNDYMRKHFSYYTPKEVIELSYKRRIIQGKLKKAQTLTDCHIIMHEHFGTSAYPQDVKLYNLGEPAWDISKPGVSNDAFYHNEPPPVPEIDFSGFAFSSELINEESGTIEVK